MKTLHPLAAALALTATSLLITGCETAMAPRRIDTGGLESLTTLQLDMADLLDATQRITQELLVHPSIAKFQSQNGRPARIDIGAIRNTTRERIKIEQVAERVTEELLNSGQVTVVAHDAGAQKANELDAFLSDAKVTLDNQADYYLEGTISMETAYMGNIEERTYTFQLRMNDRSRNQVWKLSVDITKQGTSDNRRGGFSVF